MRPRGSSWRRLLSLTWSPRHGPPWRRRRLGPRRRASGEQYSRRGWDQGHLIVQLVVEGQDPAVVAAERGVSRLALVEQLRAAVGARATRYEHLAHAGPND